MDGTASLCSALKDTCGCCDVRFSYKYILKTFMYTSSLSGSQSGFIFVIKYISSCVSNLNQYLSLVSTKIENYIPFIVLYIKKETDTLYMLGGTLEPKFDTTWVSSASVSCNRLLPKIRQLFMVWSSWVFFTGVVEGGKEFDGLLLGSIASLLPRLCYCLILPYEWSRS